MCLYNTFFVHTKNSSYALNCRNTPYNIQIKSRKQIYEKNDIGNLVLPQSDFWSKCFDHIWQEKHFCNVEYFEANKTQTRLDRFYIFWIAAQFYDDACKIYFSPSSKIWCNKSLERAEIFLILWIFSVLDNIK